MGLQPGGKLLHIQEGGMIEIRIDASNVQRELGLIIERLQRPRVLMAGIAAEMLSETESLFAAEGDPKWQALAAGTLAARRKRGTWPGKILQVSPAGLAASVQTESSDSAATIGAGAGKSAAYARIHQLGGQAGRGHKATIPSRAYMPFTKTGSDYSLTPKAEKAIMAMALKFIENGRPK